MCVVKGNGFILIRLGGNIYIDQSFNFRLRDHVYIDYLYCHKNCFIYYLVFFFQDSASLDEI